MPLDTQGFDGLASDIAGMASHMDADGAEARGYDSRWRKARAAFLQRNPLCNECMKHGRLTPATVVDHVIPHRGDQKLFWDEDNWQALCKRCHDRKTGTGM